MATVEDINNATNEIFTEGTSKGVLYVRLEDEELDGRFVTLRGRKVVNFGSCSYLGLETNSVLKQAVRHGVRRFGTQFSSSRAYAGIALYDAAEERLSEMFGRPTVLTPSTSMGHIATMPTIIGKSDRLLLDHQVHHSVQTAAKLVGLGGAAVELIPHNDLRTVERRVAEDRHRRVWFAVDGLYSMYGDFFPAAGLNELMDRHDNLWLYVDDAHAISWTGRHGRGYALANLSPAALGRTVVAASLNKSFAAAGGAFTFPDAAMRDLVRNVGGPLLFSGPIQPPMLSAVLASATLHVLPGIKDLQRRLLSRIRLFNDLALAAGLPLVATSDAPIRFIATREKSVAYNARRAVAAGRFSGQSRHVPGGARQQVRRAGGADPATA